MIELTLTGANIQPYKQKKTSAVVDYNGRNENVMQTCNVIDFIFSLLNQTIAFTYLAVFDFSETGPKLLIAIIAMILIRVLLCFLVSYSVHYGMRQELEKVLVQLGCTDIEHTKTVKDMVSKITDGELKLQVLN